jgi:epoxyqueuosine reductase
LTESPGADILLSMKLLMHICCGPCACYSVKTLREEDHEVTGFWYNPNIHPLTEYRKRLAAMRKYAEAVELPVIERDDYDLEHWLRSVVFREGDRCRICYVIRLTAAAQEAKKGGFDGFTSTLLYSRYQKHDQIIETAEQVAADYGVRFFYKDLRPGWQEGIELSKKMELYRQQYCGCILSEKERYENDQKKPGK